MDYGASFHATYCKEYLERFNLRSGKVRLADDKTLDIAGVQVVVLKTSFGTSCTLKDVRYISSLKRMLISVRQLDEEGYHIGFGDQQWKVTKGSLVVAHGNKRGSLYMVERLDDMSMIVMSMLASKGNVPDVRKVDICFCKPGGLGKQKKLSFIMLVKTRKLQRSCDRYNANLQVKCLKFDNGGEYSSRPTKFCVKNGIVMLKMVLETPLQFRFAERLSRTFRVASMGIRGCVFQRKNGEGRIQVSHTRSGSDEVRYSFRDTKSHQVIRSRDITFVDSIYGARSATDSSSLMKPIQKSQVVLVDIPENLAKKDNIVAEHGLSSEIIQSPGGSSNTSEGSENSKSLEDSERSDEEHSEDGASFKEEGFETPRHKSEGFQLAWQKENLECRLKEILSSTEATVDDMLVTGSNMEEFNKPKWSFPLVFEMKDRCSEKQVLGYVLTLGVKTVNDVHEVGDEREVEIMCSFSWLMSVLLTEDGVLPEKGYSQFNDKGYSSSIVEGKVVRSLQRLPEMESSEVISIQVGDC
nr:retrovirus-related Pol polyprotein from transposon TNT 1-94 [Tanacetum cinerariifolium]